MHESLARVGGRVVFLAPQADTTAVVAYARSTVTHVIAPVLPGRLSSVLDDSATRPAIPGEGGPEGFYLKLGFRPTGEEMGGEIVGELQL